MIAAFCTSVLFLISYVTYHAQVGSVRFTKTGAIRTVYFTILVTHVILAIVDRSARPGDALARAVEEVRPAPRDRALDTAPLDVCLGDRGRRLPHALPPVADRSRRPLYN